MYGEPSRYMQIMRDLAPGTPVEIWFDDSGFIATVFQFTTDDAAVFSGGALDGGLTYVLLSAIVAVKIGDVPVAAEAPAAAGAPVSAPTAPDATGGR